MSSGRGGDESQTPPRTEELPTYPFVLFGIPVALGFVVHLVWDSSFLPGAVAFGVGIPVLVTGTALGLWSIWAMVRQGEHPEPGRATRKIVSDGPFRFSRNPSYVALVVAATGLGIAVDSLPVLASVPFGFLVLALWVVPVEERYLSAVLQSDYEAYRSRVRRWL